MPKRITPPATLDAVTVIDALQEHVKPKPGELFPFLVFSNDQGITVEVLPEAGPDLQAQVEQLLQNETKVKELAQQARSRRPAPPVNPIDPRIQALQEQIQQLSKSTASTTRTIAAVLGGILELLQNK